MNLIHILQCLVLVVTGIFMIVMIWHTIIMNRASEKSFQKDEERAEERRLAYIEFDRKNNELLDIALKKAKNEGKEEWEK